MYLECLAKPVMESSEADGRAGARSEGIMDVDAALVTDSGTTETTEPGK